MAINVPNLTIPAGATVTLTGQVLQRESGAPMDITGKTLKLTAKRKANDADADAVISKTSPDGGISITSASTGEYTVTINAADTVNLNVYAQPVVLQVDIYLKDTAPYQVYRGTLTIEGSVTHSP